MLAMRTAASVPAAWARVAVSASLSMGGSNSTSTVSPVLPLSSMVIITFATKVLLLMCLVHEGHLQLELLIGQTDTPVERLHNLFALFFGGLAVDDWLQ